MENRFLKDQKHNNQLEWPYTASQIANTSLNKSDVTTEDSNLLQFSPGFCMQLLVLYGFSRMTLLNKICISDFKIVAILVATSRRISLKVYEISNS